MSGPYSPPNPPRAFGPLPAWFALAIVLILLVQYVPAANRPLTWMLGLILVYLLLTNADAWARVVNQFVGGLKP